MTETEGPRMPVDSGAFPLPETSPVMVLDDDAALAQSLGGFLSSLGYPVRIHTTADLALADLQSIRAGLLLVDLDLGGQDGLHVAQLALEHDPDLAIILITGRGSEEAAVRGLRLGLSDYLMKPLELEDLGRSVQRALLRRSTELRRFRNEELLRHRLSELQAGHRTSALKALGEVVYGYEAKHPFLTGHSLRVANIAQAMASELGLPDVARERVKTAGLLHDVGMIAVPDSALHHAGRLDEDDLQRIRSHPTLGAELVRAFGLVEAASFIEFHHERLDGSGYPFALKGSEIPPGALIIGVAEVYSALTEARPFREATSPRNAIDTLRGVAGMWFPGAMIEALERALPRVQSSNEKVVPEGTAVPAHLKLA